jgi:hypothetical protein
MMMGMTTENAISRLRRGLTIGTLIKGALLAGFVAALVVPQVDRTLAMVVVGGTWFALAWASAKGSRAAADSPGLIAAGQFDEAEQRIDKALRSFSLFRAAKLQALHHLALLRHAQRRWPDSARLCRELLAQRLGPVQALSKPTRLLLADAALEMNDLKAAHEAITGLYAHRLSLAEVLNLLRVQIDYEARIGAWDRMMAGVMNKVHLAELMPGGTAARVQALLAVAAGNVGRPDWRDWLRGRAELLADPSRIIEERPVLRELWTGAEG